MRLKCWAPIGGDVSPSSTGTFSLVSREALAILCGSKVPGFRLFFMSDSLPQQTEYWFPVSAALVKHPGISPAAKITWLVLCAYRDHTTGKAWPSMMSLMNSTGLGRVRIRRAIKELQSIGAITSSEQLRNGQRLDNHVHDINGMNSTQVISLPHFSEVIRNDLLKRPPETTSSDVGLTRSIEQDPGTISKNQSGSSEHEHPSILTITQTGLEFCKREDIPEPLVAQWCEGFHEDLKAGRLVVRGNWQAVLLGRLLRLSADRAS